MFYCLGVGAATTGFPRLWSLIGAAVLAGLVVSAGIPLGEARASDGSPAVNGTFLAVSNGDWAQTNESYHDEATVRATWTIATTCSDISTCSGTVVTDAGWSAPITYSAGLWKVRRDVPDWEHCADGTTVAGQQLYKFQPMDNTGHVLVGSDVLGGDDTTVGASGACGVNRPLVIKMPFRLQRIV